MSELYDPQRVRIIWNNEKPITPFMGFRDLHINPEPEFPFGRKGLALLRAWEELGIPVESIGMLLLDGDVAIDPHDLRIMHEHIWAEPECVWVAPVRIWPISHLGANWVWGHGLNEFNQTDVDDPNMFSFCFSFLPALLMDLMELNGGRQWCYPQVDMRTWNLAAESDIKVKVARGCQAKHMHW